MTIHAAKPEPPHVLLVDDDNRLRKLLELYLKKNGFRVSSAANGNQARKILLIFEFDIILLDVMMPGETGLELTKDLRKTTDVPILLLTAMNEAEDRIIGLQTGADDYLSKPFEPRELVLRIESILRRVVPTETPLHDEKLVRFGPFRFDLKTELLYRGPIITKLTESETAILKAFVQAPGVILSREDLTNIDTAQINTRTVDVQITRLRRKIEENPKFPRHLQTIRGQGYILKTGL
ncbi:MAG: DNA-binding response regulator [Rhodospirillaceae bacterium]|nr:DNA-binding response regulator [Rhodospirillaceae bacterium]|tara:strand:- start:574 stop:1284 length:711 start_codon:yes stop_codon:yes gene_type:complete